MPVIGLDGKMYVNMGDQATPDWQEVPCVRDLTINQDSGTADASSRCSGGFRSQRATLREVSIDLTYVHQGGGVADTHGWDLFTGDYYASPRNVREYLSLTGDRAAPAGAAEGIQGFFEIQTMTVNQNLEEVVTADCTLLSVSGVNYAPPQWVQSPI